MEYYAPMRMPLALLIGGLVLAASACSTAPPGPAPPAVNVSGNWAGTWWAFEGEGGSGILRGMFLQEGPRVSGQFEVIGRQVNTTFVSGHVTGNEVRLTTPARGTLVVTGTEMTGTVDGVAVTRVTLRRQP